MQRNYLKSVVLACLALTQLMPLHAQLVSCAPDDVACRCANAGRSANDAITREQGRYSSVGSSVFGQVNAAKTCTDQVASDINGTIVDFVGGGILGTILSGLISSGACNVMSQLQTQANGAINAAGSSVGVPNAGQTVINGVLYNNSTNLPAGPYQPSGGSAQVTQPVTGYNSAGQPTSTSTVMNADGTYSSGATRSTSIWDRLGSIF